LALIGETREPVVIYESAQRIVDTLADLAGAMPTRPVMVARELTKMHEELVRGALADVATNATERDWIGEVVVVLGNHEPTQRERLSEVELGQRIEEGLSKGRRAKDLAEELSLDTGLSRRDLYSRILQRRR
jgi:16S rRNA (cytidine1402-2'-O)-methyltransferase